MFKYPGISEELLALAEVKENELKDIFRKIDDISEANQFKVLEAFRKNRVSEADFNSASGYGYNETGRDKLDRVYADIFHTEDALVRSQISCGTAAIYLALSANLLPGDELLYITGSPYDSLEMSIGITPSPASLAEYGVSFSFVDLDEEGCFAPDAIKAAVTDKTKVIAIQRSKGYKHRESLSSSAIGKAVRFVKSIKSDVIVFVDNCYGEFTDTDEPSDYGADLIAGSLIKNPGGGLAPCGGYIAGRKALVERCAFRLTAPGLGREVGISSGLLKNLYQGISLAPKVVSQALKNAHFLSALADEYGYDTYPGMYEKHHCIVQAVELGSAERVIKFCRAIQAASYVDSYVSPEGWDMPGYNDSIIMASGAFVSGSSIELSADGPLREPYTVFFQGGLTFEHGKYAVLSALESTGRKHY